MVIVYLKKLIVINALLMYYSYYLLVFSEYKIFRKQKREKKSILNPKPLLNQIREIISLEYLSNSSSLYKF